MGHRVRGPCRSHTLLLPLLLYQEAREEVVEIINSFFIVNRQIISAVAAKEGFWAWRFFCIFQEYGSAFSGSICEGASRCPRDVVPT